jgi:CBS domain containing-hemolysin-like protein
VRTRRPALRGVRLLIGLARIEDDADEPIGAAALEDVLEELVGEIRDETQKLIAGRR